MNLVYAREGQIEELHAEIVRLREALEMIACVRQCLDNMMSDKDIARAALKIK